MFSTSPTMLYLDTYMPQLFMVEFGQSNVKISVCFYPFKAQQFKSTIIYGANQGRNYLWASILDLSKLRLFNNKVNYIYFIHYSTTATHKFPCPQSFPFFFFICQLNCND